LQINFLFLFIYPVLIPRKFQRGFFAQPRGAWIRQTSNHARHRQPSEAIRAVVSSTRCCILKIERSERLLTTGTWTPTLERISLQGQYYYSSQAHSTIAEPDHFLNATREKKNPLYPQMRGTCTMCWALASMLFNASRRQLYTRCGSTLHSRFVNVNGQSSYTISVRAPRGIKPILLTIGKIVAKTLISSERGVG